MSADAPQRLGFWWIAEDRPELPAVLESPSGSLTFGELAGRAHQQVHAGRARGLQPKDAIAVMVPNGFEWPLWSLTCQQAGWYFIPLNWQLSPGEISAVLTDSGAALFVAHEGFAETAQRAADAAGLPVERRIAIGAIEGFTPLEEFVDDHPTTEPPDRQAGGMLPYTSGTTGRPKGVRRRIPEGDPSQIAHDSTVFGRGFNFRPLDGRHLVGTAMHHGGSHSFYMGALHVGQALVIMPRFDPEESLQLIERHRITTAYMVPTMFHRLLQLPEEVRSKYDVSSLESVVHAAAPCPRPIKQAMMDWWGPVIWETYGGMEAPATIAKPERWLERPGTVGRAIRGVRLHILDDDGNPLPPGEVGHVYYEVAGKGRPFEYKDDPDSTAKVFLDDRRFTIGDMGYVDEDGYLFIVDRAKDMVISGGVNVYPAEVENVLLTHPAVADVAVIGVPNEEWGEELKAVVQPGAHAQPGEELAAELIEYCREHLARYKAPRSVDFRDELPRTDAGKLYKRQLKEEYAAAR